MHVLLCEDDDLIASGICAGLTAQGLTVDRVASASAARALLQAAQFDVMILDLGLPDEDGLKLLRRLRQQGESLPVLVLTARDAITDRVAGLEAGADDYLLKPFALSELAARIEAVLRRAQGGGRRTLQVADLSYDLDTLEVTREGKLLKLNPVGLKLLAVLMQKSPHVLRREVLEEALWGDDCPDSDSLRSHVHQLRQVIDKPFEKPLLHTVHGVGYRLAEGRDGV